MYHMFDIKNALSLNKLFKDFYSIEITDFLVNSHYQTKDYSSGQIIALEGDPLNSLGLILNGSIEIQKSVLSGKKVTISQLIIGDVFGEAIIFSPKKSFPSTLISISDTKVMFVGKTNVIKICSQNEKFLHNLLELLSEKILIMDSRLRYLSGESIRQKISLYLLERYEEKKKLDIHIPLTREALAEQFGIARPSLSRELNKMKREGLIDLEKHTIIIHNLALLEQFL